MAVTGTSEPAGDSIAIDLSPDELSVLEAIWTDRDVDRDSPGLQTLGERDLVVFEEGRMLVDVTLTYPVWAMVDAIGSLAVEIPAGRRRFALRPGESVEMFAERDRRRLLLTQADETLVDELVDWAGLTDTPTDANERIVVPLSGEVFERMIAARTRGHATTNDGIPDEMKLAVDRGSWGTASALARIGDTIEGVELLWLTDPAGGSWLFEPVAGGPEESAPQAGVTASLTSAAEVATQLRDAIRWIVNPQAVPDS